MTDERAPATYTHGYSQAVVQAMASRSAEREGAFFLPHLRPGMRLVDVGCGPGTITVGFAAAVAPGKVLGIDVEPAMIEQARTLAQEQGITNIQFEIGSAEELPVADAAFDAAFEHTLLEHVADPFRVVRDMHRVLRPGGVIGLADGDWGTTLLEPVLPGMADGLALYERVWHHNGGNARLGRHQRALLHHAGFRRGETLMRASEFSPDFADVIATHFLSPRIVEVAITRGWVDQSTIERYVADIRTWGKPLMLCGSMRFSRRWAGGSNAEVGCSTSFRSSRTIRALSID